MSIEIACNCGWRCNASEQYTGDYVDCPQCRSRVTVTAPSAVPYGYAPYPTWQKKVPVLLQPLVRPAPELRDPFAGTAFWAGVASIMLVFTGCGAPFGLAFAPYSIRAAARSRKWRRHFGMPSQPKAALGVLLSLASILTCATMLVNLVGSKCQRPRDCVGAPPHANAPGPWPIVEYVPPLHYQTPDASQRDHEARFKRRQAELAEWEAEARRLGLHYPVEPQRTPVQPSGDFESRQYQYSEDVRKQRELDNRK